MNRRLFLLAITGCAVAKKPVPMDMRIASNWFIVPPAPTVFFDRTLTA